MIGLDDFNINAAEGQSAQGIVAAPGAPVLPGPAPLVPGINIPDWAYYVAGGLLLAGVIFLSVRRVRQSGFRGSMLGGYRVDKVTELDQAVTESLSHPITRDLSMDEV